jgi:hypothetical protein
MDVTGVYPDGYSANHLMSNLVADGSTVREKLINLLNIIPDNDNIVDTSHRIFIFPIRTLMLLACDLLPVHDPAPLIDKSVKQIEPWILDYVRRYLYAAYISEQGFIEVQNDAHPEGMRELAQLYRLISITIWNQIQEFAEQFEDEDQSSNYGNWFIGPISMEYMSSLALGKIFVQTVAQHVSIPEDYIRLYVISYNKQFDIFPTEIRELDTKKVANFMATEFDMLLNHVYQWQQTGKSQFMEKRSQSDIVSAIKTIEISSKIWQEL